MKRKRSLIVIAIAIVLMNTICFAATTATGSENVNVIANLNDYNCDDKTFVKSNSFNHADLSNITGPLRSAGISFSIYVKKSESDYASRKVSVPNEYTTKVSMYYDGMTTQQITENLKGESFIFYAKLMGYPRVNSATIKGYLVP